MPEFFNGSSKSDQNNQTNNTLKIREARSGNKIIGLIIVLLLLVSIPVIVFYSRFRQETRQRAAEITPSPSPSPSPQMCANTITMDAKNSAKADLAVTSLTWKHTTADHPNRILIVSVETMGGDTINPTTDAVTGVTYNGQSLKQAAADSCGDARCSNSVWYIASPPIGNFDVIVTLANKGFIVAGSVTFYNLDPNNPIGTAVKNNGVPGNGQPTVTINTNKTQLVVDSAALDDDTTSITANNGQTNLWNLIAKNGQHPGGSSTKMGADGNTTMGWTVVSNPSEEWTDIAVALNPTMFDCTTPTPIPSPSTTPSPTLTPTNPPSPTSCVTPGPVKNVQITCVNCGNQ